MPATPSADTPLVPLVPLTPASVEDQSAAVCGADGCCWSSGDEDR